VPAKPPEGFVAQAPTVSSEAAPPGEPAVDPFAAADAKALADAKARAEVEDPAACLREYTRANGYGDDDGPHLRVLQSACDRAGLESQLCAPQSWLTRAAAECLAMTRAMDPDAELKSQLEVDRRRGRMIWTVEGELNTARFRRTWHVELDAQTGAMVGIRQSHASGGFDGGDRDDDGDGDAP